MFTHLDMGSMVSLDMVMLIPGKRVIKGCDCVLLYCCIRNNYISGSLLLASVKI